jgi:hypothetical protein
LAIFAPISRIRAQFRRQTCIELLALNGIAVPTSSLVWLPGPQYRIPIAGNLYEIDGEPGGVARWWRAAGTKTTGASRKCDGSH